MTARPMSPVTLGVILALAGYATYAWSDAVCKALGYTMGAMEIAFFTTIFSIIPALFATPRSERWGEVFKISHVWLIHILSAARVGSALLITYSFVTIPLAEAYSIIFIIPMFTTILSIVVLKEQVGIERWVLIGLSFIGVLIVVRPGFRELELGHLTALGCAFTAAVSTTVMRIISNKEKRISLFLIPSLYTGLAAGILMAWDFTVPSVTDWVLIVVAGTLGGAGYLFQIAALTVAPANRIAPMQYSQIVWALILGAVFFAEIPDAVAFVGLAIVIVAGLVNIFFDGARARIASRWAEFRARRDDSPPPPVPGPQA